MSKNFSLGALFSKPDVRDYTASTKLSEFPEEFELKMPKVKNQKQVGSCVAHALSTVVEYFNQQESGKYTEMSTGYIYGNRRFSINKGAGMITREALRTVSKYGDVPNKLFAVNVEVPEAITEFESKVDSIETEGYQFKFKEYFKLKGEAAIKASLMKNGPAVMAMWWFDDINVVDGVMQTDLEKNLKTSGHCMVIYGWNEIGWKVRNSWGRNWGDKGNVVIPYDVPIKEVWGVRDANSTEDADFIIQKPFSSEFGKQIAKILNSIILFVYNLVHKKEE